MQPSVPLDLDLEDRIIYGLSPQRFGYLVLAGLAAMAIWSQVALPLALRISLCATFMALGAGLAWVGWRGRGLDLQVYDAAVFLARNYRLQLVRKPPQVHSPVPPTPPDPIPGLLAVCTSAGLDLPP